MSFTSSHYLFTNAPSSRLTLHFAAANSSLRTSILPHPISSRHLTTSLHSRNFHFNPPNPNIPLGFDLRNRDFSLRAYRSDESVRSEGHGSFSFDAFLSLAELFCIVSSAVIAVSYAANGTALSAKRTALGALGWGAAALFCGVAIGAWIRRRQWRRICGEAVREGTESVGLVGRVEKLEEDLRSSAAIIRVLSRQLEKLGIRFRVTRKALKEPIAETAALAQKNSEATRALAMQEDILEKELVEIQKVLLAMQEQQQKQLELILAIAKTGKLWENRSPQQDVIVTPGLTDKAKRLEPHETQASSAIKGTGNDRP